MSSDNCKYEIHHKGAKRIEENQNYHPTSTWEEIQLHNEMNLKIIVITSGNL